MRNFWMCVAAAGIVMISWSCSALRAQTSQQTASAKSAAAPAPKRDLTGVWQYQGFGGAEGTAPEKNMPPMTPWAKAKFDLEKPGYGGRAIPGGNDPIL